MKDTAGVGAVYGNAGNNLPIATVLSLTTCEA